MAPGSTLRARLAGFTLVSIAGWSAAPALAQTPPLVVHEASTVGRTADMADDFVVVGSPFEDRARVLVGGVTGWSEQQTLTGSDTATDDEFGFRVATDGTRIVVTAPDHSLTPFSRHGAAYVFTDVGGTWVEEAKLLASDGAAQDHFGTTVAIEGNTILVGAGSHDHGAGTASGSVYVFRYNGSAWVEDAELVPADSAAFQFFGGVQNGYGKGLLLSGSRMVVGAPGDSGGAGAAYVYDDSSGSWTLEQKLTATPPQAGAHFGESLSMEGDRLVLGAHGWDQATTNNGSVWIFDRVGGVWSLTDVLITNPQHGNTEFGAGVALEDGILAIATRMWAVMGIEGHTFLYQELPGGWVPFDVLPMQFVTDVKIRNGRVIHGGREIVRLTDGVDEYCFGDGSVLACPCGNPGSSASGCDNSTGLGARLLLQGSTSVSADDGVFLSGQMPVSVPALLFHGDAPNAIPFGDGLLCAGGSTVRYGAMITDGIGNASFGPGLAGQGTWTAGSTFYFQIWYRDPVGSPCGQVFNLSNGVALTFVP